MKKNIEVLIVLLLSFRANTLIESCNKFEEILSTSPNFEFFRQAKMIKIEGQQMKNVIISGAIQALSRVIARWYEREPNVSYVQADDININWRHFILKKQKIQKIDGQMFIKKRKICGYENLFLFLKNLIHYKDMYHFLYQFKKY